MSSSTAASLISLLRAASIVATSECTQREEYLFTRLATYWDTQQMLRQVMMLFQYEILIGGGGGGGDVATAAVDSLSRRAVTRRTR